jgi:hypothetical protein
LLFLGEEYLEEFKIAFELNRNENQEKFRIKENLIHLANKFETNFLRILFKSPKPYPL